MKFFEDAVCQKMKHGQAVCGDFYLCERTAEETVFILCDGIGSGIYANIAAITCGERIMELLRSGMSVRASCETVASSMHKARKEDIPYSAFSVVVILTGGQFIVYTYEAPEAILIQNGSAGVLKPNYYKEENGEIGEANGILEEGDSLLLPSDGLTQAGMGLGYGYGIGSDGIADYINQFYDIYEDVGHLPQKIMEMCVGLSGGKYEDDMTLALLNCREARQMTIFTGPPSRPSMDRECVSIFLESPGKKVVCGSSTADIVSRESGKKLEIVRLGSSFGSPPEYKMEGVDLTTEGAVMLNQVYNILGEPVELFEENSVVERLCMMLMETDVIHLMVGNAANDAYEALLFKQVGIRIRKKMVKLLAQKLRSMGKLVTERYY